MVHPYNGTIAHLKEKQKGVLSVQVSKDSLSRKLKSSRGIAYKTKGGVCVCVCVCVCVFKAKRGVTKGKVVIHARAAWQTPL